jgi:hypothetical protein
MRGWMTVGVLGLLTLAGDAAAQDPKAAWIKDLAAGQAKAARDGRPMLVVFR